MSSQAIIRATLLACTALCGTAAAQTAPTTPAPTALLPEIDVVATTPLLGSGIDRALVPLATQVLSDKQIDRTGVPTLTGAILENIPGATVNDTDGNIFQPDILFRGFTASPVTGTEQGLAVYVNGARFNEPLGDTVNWDLIPAVAIATVNVEASNPVFGLNALGGAVNVQMKNGFSYEGGEITGYGGSFDRGAGILQYGHQASNFSAYVAGQILTDGGYRKTSESQLYQLYTDLGWRRDATEIHLDITASDNTLGNPGATPIQSLNADPSSIFTAPNVVYNKYLGVNLNGTSALSDTVSVQGITYFQNLTQRLLNGTTETVAPCNDGTGNLCNDDGTPVTGRNGLPLKDFRNGGVYSGLGLQGTDSHAFGASFQITSDGEVLGRLNHLVAGAAFDGGDVVFDGQQQIGGFDTSDNTFIGPGITQDQPSEGVLPSRLATVSRDYGLFVSDTLTSAPGLSLTSSARFNNEEIDLHDKLGTALTGQHSYNRINPSLGITYAITPHAQIYASYAESNRAPSPTELSCASAANPCSLLNFFVGDPNLKQVVSRGFEIGARGDFARIAEGRLAWDADFYRNRNYDDLILETDANNPNLLSYYTNAGKTQRQGVEASLHWRDSKLQASLGYAFTDATFQSPLLLDAGNNPVSDANGLQNVVPGDHIPGVAAHRGTLVISYRATNRWTIGGSAVAQSGQYRFDDQENANKLVGGYVVINLDTSYQLTDHVTIFGLVNNVTDRRYDTYGTFASVSNIPWPRVPGGVTDPRTASTGAPIAGYGGIKVTF